MLTARYHGTTVEDLRTALGKARGELCALEVFLAQLDPLAAAAPHIPMAVLREDVDPRSVWVRPSDEPPGRVVRRTWGVLGTTGERSVTGTVIITGGGSNNWEIVNVSGGSAVSGTAQTPEEALDAVEAWIWSEDLDMARPQEV